MHPSHQVRILVILNIRAHTTEPTTGRRKCDGPSSGNRRAINEIYPTRPGCNPAAPFSKFDRLYSPALHIPPHYFQLPLISPLFSTSTLPPLIITPTISPNLITIIYLSVLLLLVSTLPPESFPTCVFSISKVCVSKFILISLVFLFIS